MTAQAQGGHGHVLTVGLELGPTVLRIALLVAVPVLAAFGMLRGFVGAPDRRTASGVLAAAGVAVVVELLLSGGLALPEQVVPLLLAGLAVPLYVVWSRDPRNVALVGVLRRLAPWLCCLLTAAALAMFWRAWLTADRPADAMHTGVVLGAVALGWFVVSRPPPGPATIGLRVGAGTVATLLLAGAAQASLSV